MNPLTFFRTSPTGQASACILVLITVLLCVTLLVGSASGENVGGESGDDSQAETLENVVRALPGRSTAMSQTFELSNGEMETRLFQVPVNYRDEDGKWQEIDQDLRALPDGTIANGENSFDLHVPGDLDQAPVKVSVGEQWVSQIPIGIAVESAEVSQGVASYEAAGGSAEIELSGLSNGLKENIVLADASAPSTFHFRLDASQGVTPSLAEDGSISFEEGDGDVVAHMPAPVMVDSAGVIAPASAIVYALEADDQGGWRLAVEADPEWLQAEGRSFPTIIDPTITVPTPALDCAISAPLWSESKMCGTSGWPSLGLQAFYRSNGTDELTRTLLRFNLSPAIPSTAYISSATIGLYSPSEAKNVTKVDMYDLSKFWTSGTTWNKTGIDAQKWTNPGGDYGKFMPTPSSLTPAERGSSGPGWWNFTSAELAWLTQRWLDGVVPNNGVLLKFADETPRVCCIERRLDWQSSAAANKPYLSVQYIEPAMADRRVTSPSDGTKTAKRFLLTSAWEQSGVEGVTFQYKTQEGWKDIPSGQVIDQNNQTVKWPYLVTKPEDRESRPLYWDASALTESEVKIQIRAVMKEYSGISGYTKPVSAEIDKNVGGPKDGTTPVGPGALDLLTGNFTVSRTDVSIPAFNSTLEFSRSFSSRESGVEASGVLGPGWKPAAPLEEAGGSSWTKLVLKEETEEFEEEGSFTYKWAELTHSEGGVLAFDDNGSGYVTPPEMSGYVLYRLNGSEIAFTDPAGNRTVFSNSGSGNEYLPISVAMTGGPGNKTRMIYKPVEGKRRLWKVIAPAAPGISCPDEGSSVVDGCRLIVFTYQNPSFWGSNFSGDRLQKITYYAGGHTGSWDVAEYS